MHSHQQRPFIRVFAHDDARLRLAATVRQVLVDPATQVENLTFGQSSLGIGSTKEEESLDDLAELHGATV
jgi:hypothetical protein